MSGARILSLVSFGSVIVIAIVHYQQHWEREQMHKGVLNDRERVMAKKSFDKELEKRS